MNSRCLRDERGHYVFASGHAPTAAERDDAHRAIATIRAGLEELAPRRHLAIVMVVTKLHLAMNRQVDPLETKAIGEVWNDGLAGVPVAAIEAAYERFTQGASNLARNFMPKVPEFAGLARDIAKEWALTARRLELILERSEIEPEGMPLSPAGAAKLAEWKRQNGGMR